MIKIIFFFLLSFLGYSQVYIEVKLVNPNIGYPNYNQNTSNDPGLNAILSSNGVITYEYKGGNPLDTSSTYVNIYNSSNDFSNTTLLTQLQNYSSVIASATFCHMSHFDKLLMIQLITNATGTQTGTNNNIVVTNDTALNQIFTDYNIVEMAQSFPNSANNLNRYYYIRSSNCNLENLKTALQNYSFVIQTVEYVGASYLLSNETFDKKTTSIYPNPFQNELKIETEKSILKYQIIDISGKTIIDVNNEIEFNTSISLLNNGMYFLQLNYDDNTNSSHKIIKN